MGFTVWYGTKEEEKGMLTRGKIYAYEYITRTIDNLAAIEQTNCTSYMNIELSHIGPCE